MNSSKLVFFLVGLLWTLAVSAQGGKALHIEINQALWKEGDTVIFLRAKVDDSWHMMSHPLTFTTIASNLQILVEGPMVIQEIFLTNQQWFSYSQGTQLVSEERQLLNCQSIADGKSLCRLKDNGQLILAQQMWAQTGAVQYTFQQNIQINLTPAWGGKQRSKTIDFNLVHIAKEIKDAR